MSEEKPDPSIAVNADEVLADPDDQTDTCITLCCFVCCFPIALIFWIFGGSTVAIAPAVAGAAIAVDKAKKDEVGKKQVKTKRLKALLLLIVYLINSYLDILWQRGKDQKYARLYHYKYQTA